MVVVPAEATGRGGGFGEEVAGGGAVFGASGGHGAGEEQGAVDGQEVVAGAAVVGAGEQLGEVGVRWPVSEGQVRRGGNQRPDS